MRESAMPIMLTGLRGVVRGAWWDVPAARQGVILLDQLSPPLPTLESASQELSLYLQSAGLAVLRVFGSPGAGDLDACALLAAVEALRARRIERIALLVTTARPRTPSDLSVTLLSGLLAALLADARHPDDVRRSLTAAIAAVRAAVESLCGVAWLLIGSPTERLGTRADAAPDARALAEHLLAEVGEERPSAREIPSLIVPLPRDDGRRGFVPEIERLYVWVRAALGTKQAIGDWRQADARALGGARAEARSGLDPQIEA